MLFHNCFVFASVAFKNDATPHLHALQTLFQQQADAIDALQRRVQNQTNQYNRLFYRHQTEIENLQRAIADVQTDEFYDALVPDFVERPMIQRAIQAVINRLTAVSPPRST